MNLFGTKKGYYKLFRAIYSNNFYSNNYIEYESNGDKNKAFQSNNMFMKLNHTSKTS